MKVVFICLVTLMAVGCGAEAPVDLTAFAHEWAQGQCLAYGDYHVVHSGSGVSTMYHDAHGCVPEDVTLIARAVRGQ